jgi:hypothetical protein
VVITLSPGNVCAVISLRDVAPETGIDCLLGRNGSKLIVVVPSYLRIPMSYGCRL